MIILASENWLVKIFFMDLHDMKDLIAKITLAEIVLMGSLFSSNACHIFFDGCTPLTSDSQILCIIKFKTSAVVVEELKTYCLSPRVVFLSS